MMRSKHLFLLKSIFTFLHLAGMIMHLQLKFREVYFISYLKENIQQLLFSQIVLILGTTKSTCMKTHLFSTPSLEWLMGFTSNDGIAGF